MRPMNPTATAENPSTAIRPLMESIIAVVMNGIAAMPVALVTQRDCLHSLANSCEEQPTHERPSRWS
jgi:hypothetical protein